MLSLLALTLAAQEHDWKLVQSGILSGISGMALVRAAEDNVQYLIVHDNKKEGEARVSLLDLRRARTPKYQPVSWKGEVPVDLEALCSYPKSKELFVALASSGKVYVLEFDETAMAVTVRNSYTLPKLPKEPNIEGFAVQIVDGMPVLAWGHRGAKPQPSTLFVSCADITLTPIGTAQEYVFDVPWPTSEGSRGVSDLKIDPSGTLYVSAAADHGDDGPFQSALYVAGTMSVNQINATFKGGSLTRLFWTDQHKIEAFDLLPGRSGGLVFGTDDENLGGSVWTNFWPE